MSSRLVVAACLLFAACAHGESPATTSSAAVGPPTIPAAALDLKLAERALVAQDGERDEAVAQLRELGPAGLRSLTEVTANPRDHAGLIEAVAAQRGAVDSQLFWFTDLERAKAYAHRTGQPILSLRLLGKLTDEYSCANSRFFRTALYANPELAQWLRDRFVLHWSSERPVPVVTVDYGDGRQVHRTVTGNSAHYVLDDQGRPIDALPGLYGPGSFRDALTDSLSLHQRIAAAPGRRDVLVRQYHAARIDAAVDIVHDDLKRAGRRRVGKRRLETSMTAASWDGGAPTAADAAPRAMAKAMTERWLVENITGRKVKLTGDGWMRLSRHHLAGSKLHPRSVALIERERPDLTNTDELVEMFEAKIAVDTARSEYGMRVRIHDWFATGPAPTSLNQLNARVYEELFLTPASDPWLGLVESEVYTGLQGNGVAVNERSLQ